MSTAAPDPMVRLISLVAHELRTPLTVTAGYLKMLDTGRLGPGHEIRSVTPFSPRSAPASSC